jgi:hypothetical protein
MKLLIMQFSPTSRHYKSHRSKYSPEHPVDLVQEYYTHSNLRCNKVSTLNPVYLLIYYRSLLKVVGLKTFCVHYLFHSN